MKVRQISYTDLRAKRLTNGSPDFHLLPVVLSAFGIVIANVVFRKETSRTLNLKQLFLDQEVLTHLLRSSLY